MAKAKITDIVPGPVDGDASTDPRVISEQTQLELEKLKLDVANLKQDIELRKNLSSWIKWLSITSILGIVSLIALSGSLPGFNVSDTVLVALVTGVVVETLGVLAIVARYFFPSRNE